jgi:hypothetical protein
MGILLKTRKMLWGRSGNCCAFPDCNKELVSDIDETDDDVSILGEEAHIIAEESGGPRGSDEISVEQRNKYNNLILLCHDHHKIIDDHPLKYTIEILREYKRKHESKVGQLRGPDEKKQKDDEIYASYIDNVLELVSIESWPIWSSNIVNSAAQKMRSDIYDKLVKLPSYINARVWPQRYPELEAALITIKDVANDLIFIFDEHAQLIHNDTVYTTERFYKLTQHTQERYRELLDEYNYHILFVIDLVLELTRALNYLFDLVRRYLFSSFRIKEGVLLVNSANSYNTLLRTEYKEEQRIPSIYNGFKDFMTSRSTRDYYVGEGIIKSYG